MKWLRTKLESGQWVMINMAHVTSILINSKDTDLSDLWMGEEKFVVRTNFEELTAFLLA